MYDSKRPTEAVCKKYIYIYLRIPQNYNVGRGVDIGEHKRGVIVVTYPSEL